MKVFISVDMEGVAGISDSVHTNPHGYDYQPARRLMTGEANAAVQGALIVGATEIWVSDSQGGNGYRSILGTELDEEAQLITGGPRPFGQLEGIDRFFDALLLVGYHARHGVFGVLNHTTNGLAIEAVHVNGIEVGEIGLNAGLAGHYGVLPTALPVPYSCRFVSRTLDRPKMHRQSLEWNGSTTLRWQPPAPISPRPTAPIERW